MLGRHRTRQRSHPVHPQWTASAWNVASRQALLSSSISPANVERVDYAQWFEAGNEVSRFRGGSPYFAQVEFPRSRLGLGPAWYASTLLRTRRFVSQGGADRLLKE